MATTIRILDLDATVADATWTSEDDSLTEILTLFTPRPEDVPGPSEPDPDYWIARQVIEALGSGEITDVDALDDDDDPEDAIY